MTDSDVTAEAESTDDPGRPSLSGNAGSDEAPVDFDDLSVPQRAFLAATQNPSRGILVAGLSVFALGFYLAFWLSFPRVAGFLSAVALVVATVAAGVYRALNRVAD